MLVRTKRNRNGKTCSARLRSLVRAIFVYTFEFSPQTFYGHACCKAATWNSNWIPYTTANILPPRLYRTNGDFFSPLDATVFLYSLVYRTCQNWRISRYVAQFLVKFAIDYCQWEYRDAHDFWSCVLIIKFYERKSHITRYYLFIL